MILRLFRSSSIVSASKTRVPSPNCRAAVSPLSVCLSLFLHPPARHLWCRPRHAGLVSTNILPAPMTTLERPMRHSQPLASAFSSCRRRCLPPIRPPRGLRQLGLAPPLTGRQSEHETKHPVVPTPGRSRLPLPCLLRGGRLRSSWHIGSVVRNQSTRRTLKQKCR